jgi:hypothetical protein
MPCNVDWPPARSDLPVAQAPRSNKLKRRVEEEKLRQRGHSLAETQGPNGFGNVSDDIWESADALSPDDYENFEEAVVDQATAAQTIQELEAEIIILEGLEEQARQVVHSGQDRKWDELSKLLQNTPKCAMPMVVSAS